MDRTRNSYVVPLASGRTVKSQQVVSSSRSCQAPPAGRYSIQYQTFGLGLAVQVSVTRASPAVATRLDGAAGSPPSEVTWIVLDAGPSPPRFSAVTLNS